MTDVPSGMAGVDSSGLQNAADRRSEWAVAPFDTPHNFWVSAIYELPFGKGKSMLNSGVLAALAGGWSISGVLNYQSGLPLVVSQSNALPLFNSVQRPDRVVGVAARTDFGYGDFDPAIHRVFDPNAFIRAGAFSFGNAGQRLSDVRGFGHPTRGFDLTEGNKHRRTRAGGVERPVVQSSEPSLLGFR